MTRLALAAALLVAATQPLLAQRADATRPTGLSADVLGLACAPTATLQPPAMGLRITGGQDSFIRRNYAPGDLVTINAGTANGITVGQEFYVRRIQNPRGERLTPGKPSTVRTAGWIKIWAVDEAMSLATVTHACDSIEVNDYLEPFSLPQVVAPNRERPKPDRDNYARIVTGQDLRRSYGRGDFFVIDRGSNGGVTPGTQFVIFRDKLVDENFLYEIGEAVAVSVSPDLSTLQVTVSRDALNEGDLVAQRR
jgi:hypothetical protein